MPNATFASVDVPTWSPKSLSTPQHWDTVYRTKLCTEVSWYESDPKASLQLIQQVASDPSTRMIDVGAGQSLLVDRLLDLGYENITLLDVSEVALAATRDRLGQRAVEVQFLVADITKTNALGVYDLWHDRAVFHFLTSEAERYQYIERLNRSLSVNGHVIIATFAVDGPKRCSDLDVRQYDAKMLSEVLGQNYQLMVSLPVNHLTPWNKRQTFHYAIFKKIS